MQSEENNRHFERRHTYICTPPFTAVSGPSRNAVVDVNVERRGFVGKLQCKSAAKSELLVIVTAENKGREICLI